MLPQLREVVVENGEFVFFPRGSPPEVPLVTDTQVAALLISEVKEMGGKKISLNSTSAGAIFLPIIFLPIIFLPPVFFSAK
jgi:hypothetical protein